MSVEFRARVFRNGRSRAVRIPAGIDLPGDEVIFRQEDGAVTLQPAPSHPGDLLAWLATLEPADEALPDIGDQPLEPEDIFASWDDDQPDRAAAG